MKLHRLASAFFACTVVASVAAAYTPYSAWRQQKESIDEAVANADSSDFHGTFNHISAILDRGSVRNLATGDGNEGLLPGNFEQAMMAALEDLRLDIKDHFADANLTLENKATILQVVDVVVVGRIVNLYQGYDPGTCIPTPENPCPDLRPNVIIKLDSILGGVRSYMNQMLTAYNNDPAADHVEPMLLSTSSGVFDSQMDTIRGTFLTIRGVESIDD